MEKGQTETVSRWKWTRLAQNRDGTRSRSMEAKKELHQERPGRSRDKLEADDDGDDENRMRNPNSQSASHG